MIKFLRRKLEDLNLYYVSTLKNIKDFVKKKMVKKNLACLRPLIGAEFARFPFLF